MSENTWQGSVSPENADFVVNLLRQYLMGKTYSFISANENFQFSPTIRTEQILEPGRPGYDPIYVTHHNPEHAQIIISDAYSITSLSIQSNNKPYILFQKNLINIRHYLSDNKLCYWIYIIQS